jgi:hypothetical protein
MNTARLAALLRELADELDPGGTATTRQPKRARKALNRPAYTPADAPSEMDVARARRIAKQRGILR